MAGLEHLAETENSTWWADCDQVCLSCPHHVLNMIDCLPGYMRELIEVGGVTYAIEAGTLKRNT